VKAGTRVVKPETIDGRRDAGTLPRSSTSRAIDVAAGPWRREEVYEERREDICADCEGGVLVKDFGIRGKDILVLHLLFEQSKML